MWNPSRCYCSFNEACKIDEYLNAKNCSCEKQLIGKSVFECEDEILSFLLRRSKSTTHVVTSLRPLKNFLF